MKIGYQLYSALPLCETREGLIDTIKKVAEFGYDGVEFFNYNGISAAEMKALLTECGIEGCNSHVQLERWDADAEGEFAYAKEAGISCLTIPWMAPELRNKAGYQKIKELIPKLTALGKQYGIRLMYHNHDFEFKPSEDGAGYVLDSILSSDDQVELELDTFWAYFAGVDPVSYMEENKSRLGMIHLKDYLELSGGGMAGGSEMPKFAAIGTGKMDNDEILSWVKEQKLPWVVVEQDNSQIDLLESARISLENLKK